MGMQVVWEPDADNVYLSSGADNLALHQIPPERQSAYQSSQGQFLDHFGFLMESPKAVEEAFQQFQTLAVTILKPLRTHRDDSVSFYIADPDGNVIQILYEPHISPTRPSENKN